MEELIRVEHDAEGVAIQALVIAWYGQIPQSRWQTAMRLPADADDRTIAEACAKVFAGRRYFVTCCRCGERLPRGHTTTLRHWQRNRHYCHHCANEQFGIVY